MSDDDRIADLVAERARDVGADDGVEQVGERLAGGEGETARYAGSGSA